MIGRTVSHYSIIQQIGGGGMGVVYRGEDTRLRRPVALKFLPSELSRDPATKERFIHEAQAASALQHNNVCTVHEIDETEDGQIYIVMDLYEGETLRQKVERGPLPPAEANRIAEQVAQGLAAAHARGILHRDIKPANILLTADGTVKIVDFGLAKLSGRTLLTMSGTTLGTVAYTSPEGTRGEEGDQRGDIWSLGVVYYQMLTGRLPFGYEHEQAVVYNIQNADPPPMGGDVPRGCERIARKALEKDPARRYQSAEEMLRDLRAPHEGGAREGTVRVRRIPLPSGKSARIAVAGTALTVIAVLLYLLFRPGTNTRVPAAAEAQTLRRVAVLPFTNLRSDPQTDFLGFALADQIIGRLAYVRTMLVRPAMAVRQYQNQTVNAATAAKALNVDIILTGNYLKEGDVVRLSVELVDIRTDSIIWRESIEESYVNAFKLEDKVSENVVSGLRVRFSPEEARHMQADAPRDPRAYELYLKAISYPITTDGLHQSVRLLRQAITLDSGYAPAFGELGIRLQHVANYAQGGQVLDRASEAAYKRALELNGNLLFAIAGLASLYTDMGKTEDAFVLTQRALTVNPGSAENHFFLGYVYRYVGLMDDAVREMERAVALDPGNPRFRSIGITYTYLGEYEKALKGFDLDPGSPFSLAWEAYVYSHKGDTARAIQCSERLIALEPGTTTGLWGAVMLANLKGEVAEARRIMKERDRLVYVDGEQWFNVAQEHALLRDTLGTALALHNAVAGGFFNPSVFLGDPDIRLVRNVPQVRAAIAEADAKREAFLRRFNIQPGTTGY